MVLSIKTADNSKNRLTVTRNETRLKFTPDISIEDKETLLELTKHIMFDLTSKRELLRHTLRGAFRYYNDSWSIQLRYEKCNEIIAYYDSSNLPIEE